MIDIRKTKENINNMIVHRSKEHKREDGKLTEILEEALKRAETHDVLLYQAYHISFNDNKKYLKNLEFQSNINWYVDLVEFHDDISRSIKRVRPSYSKKPDRSFMSTAYLFADHFYNYETEANFLGSKIFTAMLRFKLAARKALVAKRHGKRKKAMKHLCCACHFLADMNQPHHVSNKIDRRGTFTKFLINKAKLDGIKYGEFSGHGKFEALVKSWIKDRKKIDEFLGKDSKEEFLLDTIPTRGEAYEYLIQEEFNKVKDMSEEEKISYIYNKNKKLSLDNFCTYIGRESAKYGAKYIEATEMNDTKEQIIATIRTLNMAQIQMARFLYYFCNLK